MILTHLIAFRFLRGASDTDTPVPPVPPITTPSTSLLLVNIFEIYNPIVLLVTANSKNALSTFPRGTNVVFGITSKARYQIPRITLNSDVCFISIKDPLGVIRRYRDSCTRLETSFYYSYQTLITDPVGAWEVSFYSVLSHNHYLTPVLVGYILE